MRGSGHEGLTGNFRFGDFNASRLLFDVGLFRFIFHYDFPFNIKVLIEKEKPTPNLRSAIKTHPQLPSSSRQSYLQSPP
jgi:hypothetical protein